MGGTVWRAMPGQSLKAVTWTRWTAARSGGGATSIRPPRPGWQEKEIASGRNHVPDWGVVEGTSFFILSIELSQSQTATISPKLRLECDISHMRVRTSA